MAWHHAACLREAGGRCATCGRAASETKAPDAFAPVKSPEGEAFHVAPERKSEVGLGGCFGSAVGLFAGAAVGGALGGPDGAFAAGLLGGVGGFFVGVFLAIKIERDRWERLR
jgi:hypothetical protein